MITKSIKLFACFALTTIPVQMLGSQAAVTTQDTDESVKSCRIVRMVLAARGSAEDIPTDDDFADAGVGCDRLESAISKSDDQAIQSRTAALRPIFARLQMSPSTPREQLKEKEMQTAKLSGERLFEQLPDLAMSAFRAGEVDKADTYSKQLLKMAPSYRQNWAYGNAIYDGNSVLGRIALHQGNVRLAGQYLLESGATPGSPQLNSFGPSMTLAKELLDQGQHEVVLKFLKLCKVFWEFDSGKLQKWSSEIIAGRTPDFGTNLR
jgi:hypothetical protein